MYIDSKLKQTLIILTATVQNPLWKMSTYTATVSPSSNNWGTSFFAAPQGCVSSTQLYALTTKYHVERVELNLKFVAWLQNAWKLPAM